MSKSKIGVLQKRETPRKIRVASEIKRILSEFLLSGAIFEYETDNISSMIAITDVTISADLQHAKVFVSSVSPKIPPEECIEFLDKNAFRLRGRIGEQLRLKHVPELRFFIDDSSEKAEKIENLLKSLNIPE